MLNDPSIKLSFQFLSYILGIINTLNLEMQSEQPRLHIFLPRLTFLFKQIAQNFIFKKYLDSKRSLTQIDLDMEANYIDIENIYCGSEVEFMALNMSDKTIINNFKKQARQFY